MADILTLVFKSFITRGSKQFNVLLPSACSTLVIGDKNISRSLLLFAAVKAASEMGMKVLFLTQTQIKSLPASLQHCMSSLSPDNLKNIKFVYPRTVEELLQEVASLHESTAPPSLVIVDGLEGYLACPGRSHGGQLGQQSSAAHVSALLYDTAAFLTQTLEKRVSSLDPCRVIVSFQSDWEGHAAGDPSGVDPVLQVLDRYFQVRCTLDQDRGSKPTADGSLDLWRVYLSGSGITNATTGGCEDLGVAREWRMNVQPNGSLEFSLV
ncbi:ATPase SWSAP1 [Osmerus eperlanus]|uniref:ATPase SWSAP1 n=1 Tax=Osmerus eperlanus TaxID=29151 RepID=UPI002E0F4619